MTLQLPLRDIPDTDWRLDERTRRLGRQGVEEARRQLREAVRRAAA